METELNLANLLEKSKQDKRAFKMLKELTVRVQDYEFASELRKLEHELFPETEDDKIVRETQVLLSMVGINKVSPSIAWTLYKTFRHPLSKSGKFSIKDAVEITEGAKIFDEQ